MRIKVTLSIIKNPKISYNYSYSLASAIYRKIGIGDDALAAKLHTSTNPKMYTFSFLEIKEKKLEKEHIEIISDRISFYFSSPLPEIIRALINGLNEEPRVKIESMICEAEKIEFLKKKKFTGKFKTLSPICVSTRNEEGRKIDLFPSEEKFYTNLRKNLIRKYKLLYGRDPQDDRLEIKPISVKTKMILIKNTPRFGSLMKFFARGSKELIDVGYEAGFGEKNSLGFGMVEVV